MRRVGIRELRRNASLYIRLVKAGETIEVTERDVPVARLTPAPPKAKSHLDELIEQGLVTLPRGDIRAIKPLRLKPGQKPLSQMLQKARDDERF